MNKQEKDIQAHMPSAEEVARELDERLEKIEDERREVLAKARAEGELEVEILKRNLESLKRQMNKVKQPVEALAKLEEILEQAEEKIAQPVERQKPKVESQPTGPLKLGEKVILRSLGSQGIITALSENEVEVQVGQPAGAGEAGRHPAQVGGGFVRDRRPQIEKRRKGAESGATSGRSSSPVTSSPDLELDLRGMMAEDVLARLEDYLDKAYLSGVPFVRIIHGKGTGKLRQEVRAALRHHPQVAAFEIGLENEGGDGMTVAKMVKD